MADCSIENCQKRMHAQALCMTHYSRMYRYGSAHHVTPKGSEVPIEDRMAARFRVTEQGCHEWMGELKHGYGRVTHKKRDWYAHRLIWTLAMGPIPAGLFVCHRCDNPPCINVEHLFLGTHQDNMDDCKAKGRFKSNPGKRGPQKNPRSHCKQGHKFDEENTRVNKQGYRICRRCARRRMEEWRQARVKS